MMPYILHAALILAACLSFYKIMLHKETFYKLNRFVLLACLVLSFSLPLLPIPEQWSFRKAEPEATNMSPLPGTYSNSTEASALHSPSAVGEQVKSANQSISLQEVKQWLIYLYWFGVAAFTINFLVQLASLLSKIYCYPTIIDGKYRIVELKGNKAPCSFGNVIFINPEKYDWETYNQILMHEKIHIEQRHSLDILLAEIVLIFQWFNPFAWLYRKELENNIEFLTDDLMLNHQDVNATSYQMNLLKVSAPHFPLSLTTNYNQSLLKKRVLMMNTKRSNVNTTWKYIFLLPVLVASVCLLNQPMANAKSVADNKKETEWNKAQAAAAFDMETEGVWFATIKNDKVSIQFRNDEEGLNNMNSTSFSLSEFKDLPREKAGTFSLVREPGTMEFTGKFDGEQGMGRYKFTSNKQFGEYLQTEGVEATADKDLMVFFMVDLKKSFVQMLKAEGYTTLRKNDLIPLAALHVDAPYIQAIKQAGFKDVSLHDLIPLKSLGVDAAFIHDIRNAGYPNVSISQLITFKAQGINGKYIADVRSAAKSTSKAETGNRSEAKPKAEPKPKPEASSGVKVETSVNVNTNENPSISEIIAIKSLDINPDYIRSLSEVGYNDLSHHHLIAMKSQGITAEYIRGLTAIGYKNLSPNDLIAVKTQDITREYVKEFEAIGFNNIAIRDLVPVKAMGVTPDYIKSFQNAGYKDISLHTAVSLKANDITPSIIQEYKAVGFENISLNEVVSARATGVTPAFINSLKEKGYNLKSINKYIQLKAAVD